MEPDRSGVFNYWLRESGSCSLRCAVLEFKRSPHSFLHTFNTWPLSYIGIALEANGYDATLPSGCKVLIPPRYYSAVLAHLSETNMALFNSLHRRHVIVAWEVESMFMNLVSNIPSVQNVTLKARYDFHVVVLPDNHLFIGADELTRRIIAASTMAAIFQ